MRSDASMYPETTEILSVGSVLLAVSRPFTDELTISRTVPKDLTTAYGHEFLADVDGTLSHVEVLDPDEVSGWKGSEAVLTTTEDGSMCIEREDLFHV